MLRALVTLMFALAALAVAAPAWGDVQVGSAGWQWGNPQPQGNTINALAFAGGSGYAVGDFGTILATGDGGATWRGLVSGTLGRLDRIQAIDADSIFAGGGCVGRRSDDGGRTFTRVAFTPVESSCRQPLAAAWFVSTQTGYLALADGTVIRTDNNGRSFASRTPLPLTAAAASGSAKPTAMRFLDASTGIAATTGGRVYRTTDGANSWTLVGDWGRTAQALTEVGARLLAVGDGGLFRTSVNGGVTWSATDEVDVSGANLAGVSCATDTLCVMTTTAGGFPAAATVRYEAAGAPPVTQVTPSGSPITAAVFAAPDRVVAVGARGVTTVSADAGRTFAPVGGRLSGLYTGLVAGPPQAAFAFGDNGAIARTLNGGRTWATASVPTSEFLLDVAFPTTADGFALDAAGGLFATQDGGATWTTLDTGTTSRPSSVVAPTAGTVLLVGPHVRRSTDGGESFAAAGGAISRSRVYQADRAGSAIFAYGSDSLWRSTDRGRSWKAVAWPKRYVTVSGKRRLASFITRADFLSASRGYLIADGGRLFATSNGGRTWTERFGAGTRRLQGVSFSDATRGYLVTLEVAGGQTILRTSDGGQTWAPQIVVPESVGPRGVAAAADRNDFLLAGEGELLWTTTGGQAGDASALTLTTASRRIARSRTINVTGRLSPAVGGRGVVVAYLAPGKRVWQRVTVKTTSSGAFTTSWRVRRGTNRFVAQWAGDELRAGDGSSVLTVTAAR